MSTDLQERFNDVCAEIDCMRDELADRTDELKDTAQELVEARKRIIAFQERARTLALAYREWNRNRDQFPSEALLEAIADIIQTQIFPRAGFPYE